MWKHGVNGYANHKCRCDACRQAWSEYQRAYQARYRQAHKEEKLAYTRAYNSANREVLRAKERTPEGKRRRRIREATRRASKLGQFREPVDPMVVYEMHGGRCGICGQFVAAQEFHVDHVVPISRGGAHGYINVQPAHAFCNLSKGAA